MYTSDLVHIYIFLWVHEFKVDQILTHVMSSHTTSAVKHITGHYLKNLTTMLNITYHVPQRWKANPQISCLSH